MKKNIKVVFEGVIQVEVPDGTEASLAQKVAEDKALCFILASLENPDAPEMQAFDEFEEVGGSEEIWDETKLIDVSGNWKVSN